MEENEHVNPPYEGCQTPYGPIRACQGGRIQEKHPRANSHPWITLVFSLKGEIWSHMDQWTHNKVSNMKKVAKHTPWHVGIVRSPNGQVGLGELHRLNAFPKHLRISTPLIKVGLMVVWSNKRDRKAHRSLTWHPYHLHL